MGLPIQSGLRTQGKEGGAVTREVSAEVVKALMAERNQGGQRMERRVQVLVVVALLMVAGSFLANLVLTRFVLEVQDKYALLTDLLAITLSVLAIAVAVFGIGAYRLLKGELRDYVVREASREGARAWEESAMSIGWVAWQMSRCCSNDRDTLLNFSITVTRRALSSAEGITAGEQDQEDEKLAALCKNNLAYYYADQGDTQSAEAYSSLLSASALQFPDLATQFADTLSYVEQRKKENRA